jgi:hypothetical protein
VSFSGHFCVDGRIMQIRESIQNWKGLKNAINIPGSTTSNLGNMPSSQDWMMLSNMSPIVPGNCNTFKCLKFLREFNYKILIWKKSIKFRKSKVAEPNKE